MFVCLLFKQKTAYELRISDWSSDVCSSDRRPSPPQGEITGEGRVVAVYDKGDKGAVGVTETSLRDGATGDLLATVRVTSFARADGHCGAPSEGAPDPHKVPDRAPDLSLRYATRPDLAFTSRQIGRAHV